MEKQGGAYYRYSYRELSAFCLQISLLLESAVPLDEGLAIMAEDAADKKEKDMLLYMAEGVELGDPFFKVLEDTKVFPDYVVKMAKLGQSTGTMDQMMKSPVSYTHLDVYKRQSLHRTGRRWRPIWQRPSTWMRAGSASRPPRRRGLVLQEQGKGFLLRQLPY